MRLPTGCLPFIVAFFIKTTWSALVPVTLRQSDAGLTKRDAVSVAELLRPAHDIKLLYADDSATESPTLVTLSVGHESHPFVVIEDIENLLSRISCHAKSPDHPAATLSLTFQDPNHLHIAEERWSGTDKLGFVTHHDTCNDSAGEREVYRTSSIHFDYKSSTAIITGEQTLLGTTDANTSLHVRGGLAPKHVARSLNRRWLGKRKRDLEASFLHNGNGASLKVNRRGGSLRFDMNREWRPWEKVFEIPGQAELFCVECHKSGALSLNFEFRVRSVSPQELVQYIGAAARGEKPEPLVTASRYWVEVLEPIVSVEKYLLKVHAGLMVRYPGLMKRISDKKEAGDNIFWDKEVPFFTIGAYNFMVWQGWGTLLFAATSIKGELAYSVSSRVEAGSTATVDFVDMSKSTTNLRQPHREVKIESAKFQSAAVASVAALTVNVDVTVRVAVPRGKWKIFVNGRSRGDAGFKDSAVASYFGVYYDFLSINGAIESPQGRGADCEPSDETEAIQVSLTLGNGIGLYFAVALYAPDRIIPRLRAMPMAAKEPYYHTWPVGRLCFVTKRKLRRKPMPQAPDKPEVGAPPPPLHSPPPNAPPSPTNGDLRIRPPNVDPHARPHVPKKPAAAHEGSLDAWDVEPQPRRTRPAHAPQHSPPASRPDSRLEALPDLGSMSMAQPIPVQDRGRPQRDDEDDRVAKPPAGKVLSLEELTALTGRPYYGHDSSPRQL